MVKKRGKLLNIKEGFIASERAEAVGGAAPPGRLPGPSRARRLHTPGGRVAWAWPSGADKPFVEAEVEAPLEEEPTDRNVTDERYQAPHVPDAISQSDQGLRRLIVHGRHSPRSRKAQELQF